MSGSAARFVIALFSLLISLPSLSILLPGERTEVENRRLTAPRPSVDRLLTPEFYADVLTYVRDANPVRSWMIRGVTTVDYSLLGDSPNPSRVLIGDHGWLYDRDSITSLCETEPAEVVDGLLSVVATIRATGPEVIFSVAPAKVGIVAEHLEPPESTLAACAMRTSATIEDLLRAAADPGYVDMWALFDDLGDDGTATYFRTDTHFNYVAAVGWVEAVVHHLDHQLWEPSAVADLGSTDFLGNLAVLAGLRQEEMVRHVVVDRGRPVVPDSRLHEPFSEQRSATEVYSSRRESSQPELERDVLVLKDSFMDIPMQSLVQYLGSVTFTDWRSEESVRYFMERAAAADVVLIETAEEHLAQRFGTSGEPGRQLPTLSTQMAAARERFKRLH